VDNPDVVFEVFLVEQDGLVFIVSQEALQSLGVILGKLALELERLFETLLDLVEVEIRSNVQNVFERQAGD